MSKNEIKITIEGKEWEEAIKKSFEKNSKDVEIDGFRKGKVPFDTFVKKFGVERLYGDAIDIVLPSAYDKAFKDSDLVPVVRPDIEITSVDDKKVDVLIKVTTKPEIKIKKYTKLGVKKEEVKVTDEELAAEISRLKQRFVEMVLKEEGSLENGDTAIIDFEGFKGDKPFDGGKAENHSLEIGSNSFIPGFEEALIGMNLGEEKSINLTFPEEYPSDDLKGAEVIFKVKLNEIKIKKEPDMNDDFFEDLAMDGVTSKETLEKELKKTITAQKEQEFENAYIDKLLEEIGKTTEVEIPDGMIVEETERIFNQFAETLKMQGMEINQYLNMVNKKEEDLKDEMKDEGKKRVLYRLILDEIGEKENITVDAKEVDEKTKELAEKYKMDEKSFLDAFGGKDMVEYDLKMRKTFEFIKENN